MKRIVFAALAAVALAPGVVQAQAMPYVRPQVYNPYSRPTISPYLNLTRPGANPALNYYGLVKPQMETTQALQHFQQELMPLTSGLGQAAEQTGIRQQSLLPTTGHQTTFYNYGNYFPVTTGIRPGGTLGGTNSMSRPQFGSVGGARPPRMSGMFGGGR